MPKHRNGLKVKGKIMKVLVADKLGQAAKEKLEALGTQVTIDDCAGEELKEKVAGKDILIVRSTKVTAEIIDAADRLGLIVRAGAGTDTIDCAYAASRGVFVCNVPGKNATAVAELTMALILAIDRQIVSGASELKAGNWDKKRFSKADGIAGKTVGIIGLGSIGLEVARRAKAFDTTVIAERKPNRDLQVERTIRSLGIRLVDGIDALLAKSDIVSVHVPGGEATRNLIDAEFLSKIKPGAILINTSRGSIMHAESLLQALESDSIRVGLDVYPDEPEARQAEFSSPIASHRNVIGSHHIGASTTQASEAILDGVVEVIANYQSGDLSNCVNLAPTPKTGATIVVRHIDRVGVLASVLDLLAMNNLNVAEMSNRVFAGANSAVASIDISGLPTPELLGKLSELDSVLGVQLNKPPQQQRPGR